MIKIKAFKMMGFGTRKSKSGFTLIELLIVMVIIAILAGVIVMAVGGVFGTAKSSAYNTARDQIQNAVTAYSSNYSGALPSINNTAGYTSANLTGTTLTIVNVSLLLTENGGMLRTAPDGLNYSAAAGSDNCNGVAGIGCEYGSHYVWLMDQYGTVASICRDCPSGNGNETGYQGVWP